MADYYVRAETDWRETFWLGRRTDRWRADDYDIYLQIKRPGAGIPGEVLLEASTIDGRIAVVDAKTRRLEINIGWLDMADLEASLFEFDFLLINRTTEQRDRSVTHSLTVLTGVTSKEP